MQTIFLPRISAQSQKYGQNRWQKPGFFGKTGFLLRRETNARVLIPACLFSDPTGTSYTLLRTIPITTPRTVAFLT